VKKTNIQNHFPKKLTTTRFDFLFTQCQTVDIVVDGCRRYRTPGKHVLPQAICKHSTPILTNRPDVPQHNINYTNNF
jgi:hypothetical protein